MFISVLRHITWTSLARLLPLDPKLFTVNDVRGISVMRTQVLVGIIQRRSCVWSTLNDVL